MQRATSWSRIARDNSTLESREATNVSPCIAFNAIGLFASYFLRIVLPNSPYIFATVTNVSFLLASFYIQHRITSTYDTKEDGESIKDSYFISNLATCASIFLALLGASSLAFHSESVLFQPSHSFDILFGWMLILNIAFTSFCVAVYAWAGRRRTRQFHSAAFVSFLGAFSILILGYDWVYTHQLEYYIPVASFAIVCAVVSRMILVGKRPTASTFAYAVGEIIILICIAVSAVFCQGELLGTKLSRESTPDIYDLFHGNWHFLLSTVASVVSVRSLSVARMIEKDVPVCVCKPSTLDVAGEIALFVYACSVVLAKEIGFGADVSLIVSGVVSCALYVHAFITGMSIEL